MNDNHISNRQAICDVLLELAASDPNIIVLTSDSRGSGSLAAFAAKYPAQHVEVGIAEQNIVGIAAGFAAMGKKPIAASPASFLSMRAIEQIKVDVAYSHMPVVLYGISGGLSYGALGMTHHSLQDIAAIGAIPGIDILLPADRFESAAMIRDLMKNPRPAYLRIGRNPTEDVYEGEDCGYTPGRATCIQEGRDACIIACGEMVYPAQQAVKILAQKGISVRLINMHTIKPFDTSVVLEACETKFILTAEEHSCYGGLGSRVAEIVSGFCGTKMHLLAIPDEPAIAGSSAEVFNHYGLTAENMAAIIEREVLSR